MVWLIWHWVTLLVLHTSSIYIHTLTFFSGITAGSPTKGNSKQNTKIKIMRHKKSHKHTMNSISANRKWTSVHTENVQHNKATYLHTEIWVVSLAKFSPSTKADIVICTSSNTSASCYNSITTSRSYALSNTHTKIANTTILRPWHTLGYKRPLRRILVSFPQSECASCRS